MEVKFGWKAPSASEQWFISLLKNSGIEICCLYAIFVLMKGLRYDFQILTRDLLLRISVIPLRSCGMTLIRNKQKGRATEALPSFPLRQALVASFGPAS